jgi:two-component system, sensor histidine kinase LadS
MYPKLYLFFFLLLLGLFVRIVPIYAQSSVPFTVSNYPKVPLETTFDEINRQEVQQKFQPTTSEKLNFGYTEQAVWIKIIVPPVINSKSDYMLWVNYATIDYVDLYQLKPIDDRNTKKLTNYPLPNYHLFQSGDMLPFTSRQIKHRKFAFPVRLSDSLTTTFYLRVQSKSSLQVPIEIVERKDYELLTWRHELGLGVFYGAMLIMFFYNLFIFIVLKDKNYLFYILSIVASSSTFGSLAGHQSQYLFPNLPYVANLYMPISGAAFMTSAAAFALSFLEMKKYTPIFYRIYLFFIVLGIILIALCILLPQHYGLWGRIVISTGTLSAFMNLVVGVISLKNGNKAAKYYLLAFFFYMVGIISLGLRSFGITPINFVTLNAAEIGGMLEIMLLSFALSDKYSIYRREREKAQKELLQMQQEQNAQLERKVEDRTVALNENNEELRQINEELFATVELSKAQSEELRAKNHDIMSSINYARRIQNAILPSNHLLKTYMPPHFVYYAAKDVVSGDFYWFAKTTDYVFFAVADCTGHGVPGAFMTVMSNDMLNQIVNDRHIYEPAKVLAELDRSLTKTLQIVDNDLVDKETELSTQINDGLDIALIRINSLTNEVIFSGANRSLLHFSSLFPSGFVEISENKFPIGSAFYKNKSFQQHLVVCQPNDLLYLFTDGYADQFGGQQNKKFMVRKLKNLLADIHTLPPEKQKNILQQTILEWKGETKQTDDILIAGIKFV